MEILEELSDDLKKLKMHELIEIFKFKILILPFKSHHNKKNLHT